ncbi:hypothetical protein K1719_026533 [Acacia pycnantha]|nr:hypothetical protein K1719_026533 [Acacia pycnantha]
MSSASACVTKKPKPPGASNFSLYGKEIGLRTACTFSLISERSILSSSPNKHSILRWTPSTVISPAWLFSGKLSKRLL